ncbi:hypothetical protein FNV43_RR01276 [Rhamnella rubrinervis]|uniref:Pentatricopeptide repeat-containing protein n=1 Tax=Rhamnella rubrinervis TaxID=2594499 RepID=A0A8K0MS50_9ROSA|nr:hypothetical protein FNV43_RR01276 [Rhamnella rubrinervis]
MGMKTKMINKAAAHFGNASFFTLFRSYSASGARNSTHLVNLIEKRCKSGTLELDEALGFFHSLIHTRPMPSVRAFNHLVGALSKSNRYSTVVSMFREMMNCVDFHPDLSMMTIAMKCYCRLGKVDLAFSVLATTLKRGLQPDAYIFNTLLHGLCSQSESMDDALEFFKRIVGRGDQCNQITYATIIGALCKTHNTLKAIEIFKEMQKVGNIKTSADCFNPIIDSLCKERHVDKALELFQDMVNQDVEPDVVTYTALFDGLIKSGRVEEAKKFFNDMIDHGISPNVYSYNALMDTLFKEGKTHEAISLFELMIRRSIKPDVVTFNSLISGLSKSGQFKKASQVLNNMIECGTLPDVVTYSTILDALCKEGRTVEAFNLLEAMSDTDIKPNIITYNSLIYGLCHSGQWREATRLVDKMKDQGVLPDVVTFSTVVDALCRERMTKEALSLLHLMIQRDLKPDVITYTSLLNALCKSSQWEEATRLLKQMVSLKVFPNTMTLNLVLDALAKKEMTGKAYETFELVIEHLKNLYKNCRVNRFGLGILYVTSLELVHTSVNSILSKSQPCNWETWYEILNIKRKFDGFLAQVPLLLKVAKGTISEPPPPNVDSPVVHIHPWKPHIKVKQEGFECVERGRS